MWEIRRRQSLERKKLKKKRIALVKALPRHGKTSKSLA
jgi:hypothetical protein